eukprot:gene15085-23035_t
MRRVRHDVGVFTRASGNVTSGRFSSGGYGKTILSERAGSANRQVGLFLKQELARHLRWRCIVRTTLEMRALYSSVSYAGRQTISRLLLLYKQHLTMADTAGLQELFSNDDGLFIDEMSMLRVSDLALVEERLRVAKQKNEPFGGVAVILVGDFFQLPPVMGVPLYSASAGKRSAAALGIGDFKLMELAQQHRALEELTNNAKHLGPGDPWPQNTSLIVASNAEAATATKFLSQKFARERGLPVACFSLLLGGGTMTMSPGLALARSSFTCCVTVGLSYDRDLCSQRVPFATPLATEMLPVITAGVPGTKQNTRSLQ